MDTKWKKWKIIISFTAFFLGLTLLVCNLGPVLSRLGRGTRLTGDIDYQDTAAFRGYICERLEEFLGIATGGKGWRNYGAYYEGERIDSGFRYKNVIFGDAYTTEETFAACQSLTPTAVTEGAQSVDWLSSYEVWLFNQGYSASEVEDKLRSVRADWECGREIQDGAYWEWQRSLNGEGPTYGAGQALSAEEALKKALEEHMGNKAYDKNLLYAIVYQDRLLYSNIEDLKDRTGSEWDGEDFQAGLSPEEYNFTLWFNRKGDGRVQIQKDGQPEDVYGGGIYTGANRWFVPGYSNFSVDESAGDAVIFLAAAKLPRLYVVGNYSEYGAVEYGWDLYYMRQDLLRTRQSLRAGCLLLAAGALLLLLSFLLRRDRRLAKQAIAGLTGRLWLEAKLLLFWLFPILLLLALLYTGYYSDYGWTLREFLWSADWNFFLDASFEILTDSFNAARGFFVLWFWPLWLGALDCRYNRGRQKTLVLDALRAKDLKLPLQKRMIKRFRTAFLTGLMLLPLGVCVIILIAALTAHNAWQSQIVLNILAAMLLFALYLGINIWLLRRNRRLAEDLGNLSGQIARVKEGCLNQRLELPPDSELKETAENLNRIQQGMDTALQEQMHSERMKVALVSNVSHDIKTPLTSIISYVELLKQEEDLPAHVKEYIQILGEKSERLKDMVQDVFEVSKATSGQLPVELSMLDLGKLLRQTLADMDDRIAESGLTLRTDIPETPAMVRADGQRLYRVFQNLLQNALKYSLPGSRIFLTLTAARKKAAASAQDACVLYTVRIKNTSCQELTGDIDFTERFVRGDESRTDGGSGLGLSIARSFTEACGGSFRVETDADLFTVTVEFQEAEA